MSAPMKAHRTDRVRIIIKDRKTELFLVTPEKARTIRALLDAERMQDFIPAEELLTELYASTGKAGTLLRGLRTREGLTQSELARKLNCPQSWISGWENGNRSLGKKMAMKIGKTFRVDYRVFL